MATKYQQNFNRRILDLAVKYYGTTDLKALTPYQLDKITTWVTWNPNKGKNRDSKAGRSKGRYAKNK